MKKIFVILSLLVGLTGCIEEKITNDTSIIPNFIILENEAGQTLGRGFVLDDEVGIAPDHLFDLTKSLYWKGQKLEILIRDFEKDIIVFRFLEKITSVNLSDTPPAVGNRLYWFDNKRHRAEILGVGVSFEAAGKVKKNLILLDGQVEMGISGGMLFDSKGKVWGMITGADRSKNQIYAVRSDSILGLLKDQVVGKKKESKN